LVVSPDVGGLKMAYAYSPVRSKAAGRSSPNVSKKRSAKFRIHGREIGEIRGKDPCWWMI
jgi:phosphoribosylpyrophosphate synthetase